MISVLNNNKKYILFCFNVVIILYLMLYALNSLYSFIDGFQNLGFTSNNAFLMVYLFLLFISITLFIIRWYIKKEYSLHILVVLLIAINMFY